ncbi:hypothetical protein C2S51_003221 [Perilla frutescens var. frutescens]|nr:hypothetical protein C2S51_003221 [Perilla frutescens var. frutescens]
MAININPFSSSNFVASNACKFLLILGLSIYLFLISLSNNSKFPPSTITIAHDSSSQTKPPTNLSHLVFGLLGSEKAWHDRRHYIESWWRPNTTRGLVYLDKPPTGDLLPWSDASPPYRVSDNLDGFLEETKARAPVMIRMVHGIMEVVREMDREDLRWVVMGDDDSIFMVENIVDVLGELDDSRYYYVGGKSEFIMSNYWFSFNQGFGGAGFMLSYPLAKALANDMENCLRRNAAFISADFITMLCISDIGVNLSPHNGIHQIDLRGNLSGFLSSHPKSPLISLHHLDAVEPIFPDMDRYEAARHLMKAAAADQPRMLQQTICHHRQSNWSISVSWGYSAHIYERIIPRSRLQLPLETFEPWSSTSRPRPLYMFNTRLPSNNSCEAPHVFFFKEVRNKVVSMHKGSILTTYSRAAPRGMPPCAKNTADFISEIRVFSPATKRKRMDRCECCDIISVGDTSAELKFRECMMNEVIA